MSPLFWQALTLLRGDRTNAQLAACALEGTGSTARTITALANYFSRIMNGRVPRVSVETAQKLARGLGYTSLSVFFTAFEDAERTAKTLATQQFVQNGVQRNGSRGKHTGSKRSRRHEAQHPFTDQLDTLTRAIEEDTQVSVEAAQRAVASRQKRARLERAHQTITRAHRVGVGSPDHRDQPSSPRARPKKPKRRP